MEFVNPYVFIPLGKGTPEYRREDDHSSIASTQHSEESRYTGVLNCVLTTKTPISVPDVSERTESLGLPFYRVGGKLAIPGSSLRGCVRSVFEVLTDSCLRTNSRRLHSVSPKKNPGLLMWSSEIPKDKDGKYLRDANGSTLPIVTVLKLVEAERLRVVDELLVKSGRSFKYSSGQAVQFTGKSEKGKPYVTRFVESIGKPSDNESGYFLHVHTLYSGTEHNHPSIFKQHGKPLAIIDDETRECLVENVDSYVKNSEETLEYAEKELKKAQDEVDALPVDAGDTMKAKEAKKALYDATIARNLAEDNLDAAVEYQKRLKAFLANEKDKKARFPVWYARENVNGKDEYQLAASQFSRSVFPQTPVSLAGEERRQCAKASKLCPACSLFGFVADKGGAASAGRVRFSDAVVTRSDVTTRRERLATLLEPRQSSFEFYLRNTSNGHQKSFTPFTPGTELAGRKAYWHHQKGGDWLNTGEVTQFTQMAELVPGSVPFAFSVYVNGVTQLELNRLVYALTYGQWWGSDATNRQYYHRIGHGKPIGLGSVLIEVKTVALRNANSGLGSYTVDGCASPNTGSWDLGRDTVEGSLSSVKAAKAVAAFSTIGKHLRISYPVSDSGDIFKWFADNRDDRGMRKPGGKAALTYTQVLQALECGDNESYTLTESGKGSQQAAGANTRQPNGAKKKGASGGSQGAGNKNNSLRPSHGRGGSSKQWAIGDKGEGRIKKFFDDKGFGYIECPGYRDIFLHISAVRPRGAVISEGMHVQFEVVESKARGHEGEPCAFNVHTVQS